MATASTPLPLPTAAQAGVISYFKTAVETYASSYNIRPQLLLKDLIYYRELDQTTQQRRAKVANNSGDASKLQNLTIPVVMPQVDSALADLQEIFLTGYPIFGTVTVPGQEDAAGQMDTIIGENSVRAGWPLQLLQVMRDGLKYDLGAVEVIWENKKLFAITSPEATNITQGALLDTYYQGNFLKRLDPYNLILDPRVSPDKNHLEGELAGYSELISRIEMKKRMENLPALGTMNFADAFNSPSSVGATGDQSSSYYVPQINPDALLQPGDLTQTVNWLQYMNLPGALNKTSAEHKSSYEWTVLYCRILPSDFGMTVPNKNHVQIWKFIIVNRNVVIFAERQTNAHNYLPIIACKPSADPLGWQAKSFADNAAPIQTVASSLLNSALESQRRKVYDRLLYDPSKINKADIDKVSSVARIPVKNVGYGKNISDSIYQIPYRDDGVAEILQFSQQVTNMADAINGQNRVSQGQFQKGNKTRREFETVMNKADSRGRMRALALEFSFFVPIKEIVKSNILQFQPPTKLVNRDTKSETTIDPQKLREANLSFMLSDGYAPSEKLMGLDLVLQFMQAAQAMPEIRMQYDLMGMFLYNMKLSGANWLDAFKYTPDQQKTALGQMQASSAAANPNQPPAATPSGVQ
jgi:hypothetical protein